MSFIWVWLVLYYVYKLAHFIEKMYICSYNQNKKIENVEHKEFVSKMQQRLGKSKDEVEKMLDGFCRIVVERCTQLDTITVQGLGTFEGRKKMERVSVNPATGKRMLIPPKIVLAFKPNSAIKNCLKERR